MHATSKEWRRQGQEVRKASKTRHGAYYLFDTHYPVATSYVQTLRTHAKTVQRVGSQCERSDVNDGEDSAVHNAYSHPCVHCMGAQQCAEPLMYPQLLYPRIDDIDK